MRNWIVRLLAGALLLGLNLAQAAELRVDPPHWWVGMRQGELQLLLHGPGVGALQARLQGQGVQLLRSQRLDSPNYLALQLRLGPQTRPGRLTIELREGRTLRHRLAYELRARAPGSAQRQGFGPQDAVYLVVPDRFANGDPANDRLPGFDDALDRANPDARHGGDLLGIQQRLDYLAGMGFTQLWLTAPAENRQPSYSYHGYAPTDLYRIDPRLGGNPAYLALAAAARQRGIGLIHDVILNHIGSGHPWVSDPPMRDWLHPRQPLTNHAHISVQDPHGHEADRRGFADGAFDTQMPDLNQRQPLLAQYLIQNTLWWIEEAGLSGIREDTYSYSDKQFLARWVQAVRTEYPRLNLVGEEMSNHPPMVAYWMQGSRNHDGYRGHMPSMMDFPVVNALRQALTTPEGHQQGLYTLYETFGLDFVYADASQLMLFDGNHDTNRIAAALDGDLDRVRMALAVVATAPRIPQFFYGTEIALQGPKERQDGLVRADFPGGWAGDAADALSGRGLRPEQLALQAWLRQLLNWRKGARAVHSGRMTQFMPQQGGYFFIRHGVAGAPRVLVALNQNAQALQLDLRRAGALAVGAGRDVLSGERLQLDGRLELAARGLRVIELDQQR